LARAVVQFFLGFCEGIVKIAVSLIVIALHNYVIPPVLFEDCILIYLHLIFAGLVSIERRLHLTRDLRPPSDIDLGHASPTLNARNTDAVLRIDSSAVLRSTVTLHL
jgi:hypothetical protein